MTNAERAEQTQVDLYHTTTKDAFDALNMSLSAVKSGDITSLARFLDDLDEWLLRNKSARARELAKTERAKA